MLLRRRPVASGLAALALTTLTSGLLSGCGLLGGDTDPAAASARDKGAAAAPADPEPTPVTDQAGSDGAADPATPVPDDDSDGNGGTEAEPPAPEGPAVPLPDQLLSAGDLPALGAAAGWSENRTATDDRGRPFGICHRFAMTSIGADQVVLRGFAPETGGPETAGAMVAAFADEKTARQAFSVLASWHASCGEQLEEYAAHQVGPVQTVAGAAGDSRAVVLSYGPAEEDAYTGYLDGQGFVRVGDRIALVQLRRLGDPGGDAAAQVEEAVAAAVRTAAAKLG